MATQVGAGTKSERIEPLTTRKAWKALHTHYEKVRQFHLRISSGMTPSAAP